ISQSHESISHSCVHLLQHLLAVSTASGARGPHVVSIDCRSKGAKGITARGPGVERRAGSKPRPRRDLFDSGKVGCFYAERGEIFCGRDRGIRRPGQDHTMRANEARDRSQFRGMMIIVKLVELALFTSDHCRKDNLDIEVLRAWLSPFRFAPNTFDFWSEGPV